MARQTKLTPELQEELVKVLRIGGFVEQACKRVGISRNTYYEWRKRGEEDEEPYATFLKAVDNASDFAELEALTAIRTSEQWTAKAWYLERRFPERWAVKNRHDVQFNAGPSNVTINIKHADIEDPPSPVEEPEPKK